MLLKKNIYVYNLSYCVIAKSILNKVDAVLLNPQQQLLSLIFGLFEELEIK